MKNILALTLLMIATYHLRAQTNTTALFKNNEIFEKRVVVKTATTLHNGNRQLNTKTSSVIASTYTVTNASGDMYQFLLQTKRVIDTLNVDGIESYYDTEKRDDTSSGYQQQINSMPAKTTGISVNTNGMITTVQPSVPLNNTDSFFAYVGLAPDKIIAGNKFELVALLPGSMPGIGYSWTDTANTLNGSEITTYTIDKITTAVTIIRFTGFASKKYDGGPAGARVMNTNIAGRMVINNSTGFVTDKMIKTTSSGYQQIQGKTVSLTKSTVSVESLRKIE